MSLEEENSFQVALTIGGNIVIGYYRGTDITPDQALNLAAWLSQLALEAGGNFEKYVDLCERIEASRHGSG